MSSITFNSSSILPEFCALLNIELTFVLLCDRGNGQQAQLGRKIIERRKTNGLDPERLAIRNIVLIGSGSYHSFAVDKAGVVYAWVSLNYFVRLNHHRARIHYSFSRG